MHKGSAAVPLTTIFDSVTTGADLLVCKCLPGDGDDGGGGDGGGGYGGDGGGCDGGDGGEDDGEND